MKDVLDQLIDTVDLPALVGQLYPASGARPGKAGLYRAVWRGDRHPSLSLFKKRGVWFWKDHATGKGGNAFHLLIEAGYTRAQAAALLKGAGPVSTPAAPIQASPAASLEGRHRPLLEAAQARLDQEALRGRGMSLAQGRSLGLGKTRRGDLLIPLRDPQGKLKAIKCRRRGAAQPRYYYLTPGCGAPPWFSPGFTPGQVLLVEGELNAMVCWLASGLHTVGVAGAEAPLPPELEGGTVYLYADPDPAGRRALARWRAEGARRGLKVLPLPPLPEGHDACSYAERHGQAALRKWLEDAGAPQQPARAG